VQKKHSARDVAKKRWEKKKIRRAGSASPKEKAPWKGGGVLTKDVGEGDWGKEKCVRPKKVGRE